MSKFLDFIEKNKINNRPICFFTLNDTLTKIGIRETVRKLSEGGFGGVYIHCRSGYTGNYLQQNWFEACDELISVLNELGMEAWVYDEFGWPSGIAGGNVLKKDANYRQKWLVKNLDVSNKRGDIIGYYTEDKRVTNKENAFFSLEVVSNPSYVDVLNASATNEFILETYEKYRLRYGDKIKGFFTDEPQFGLESSPWNDELEQFFINNYENWRAVLPHLFDEDEQGCDIRLNFHKTVSQAFINNYITPISEWCNKYGYKLTGHMLEEKELYLQTTSAGDIMGVYKQMQAPGVDWLGPNIGDMKTPKQVSSVCQRYGKDRSVTESFALIGYGASFDVMKNIVDWQIAGGISNVCNVMGYSLRGRRKRDYPAGFAFVQPYYDKVAKYNDYLAKLCTIPAMMEEVVDVLLIEPLYEDMKSHPYGKRFNLPTSSLSASEKYNELIKILTENQILFHLASPSELSAGIVENGNLKLGKIRYKTVISIDDETDKILNSIGVNFVTTAEDVQKRIVLTGESKGVYASVYNYENGFVAMLKNLTDKDVILENVTFDGKEYSSEVDLSENKLSKSDKIFIQAKGLKIVLFDDNRYDINAQTEENTVKIDNDNFTYKPEDKNLLVLDFCEYEIENQKGRSSVINLFENLISKAYKGKLKMQFFFDNRGFKGDDCELIIETPEFFQVYFNGERVDFNGNVAKINLIYGINEVTMLCDYEQDERSRQILCGESGAEGDFNMIGKLFELENIYIRGDFGVFAEDTKMKGKMIEATEFYISNQKNTGSCNSAVVNGYPYYVGKMVYQKKIRIEEGDRFISVKNICGASDVYLDGEFLKTILWNDGKILIPQGMVGDHILRVENYNTIRNAIGPNHNIYDEGIMVGYTTFSGAPGWCDIQEKNMWTDVYRLAVYGIEMD